MVGFPSLHEKDAFLAGSKKIYLKIKNELFLSADIKHRQVKPLMTKTCDRVSSILSSPIGIDRLSLPHTLRVFKHWAADTLVTI